MSEIYYDRENNFSPFDLEKQELDDLNRLRLLVAAEFLRCQVYGPAGIDRALDDADTALGILNRLGLDLFFMQRAQDKYHGEV